MGRTSSRLMRSHFLLLLFTGRFGAAGTVEAAAAQGSVSGLRTRSDGRDRGTRGWAGGWAARVVP